MIKQIKAYQVSDGSTAATLEEAQTKELTILIAAELGTEPDQSSDLALTLVNNRDKVLDILTTGPNSRPARRKVNGGTTRRRKAAVPEHTNADK